MSLPSAFADLGPADGKVAERVFEFVQYLLDDDTNLTPTGNLTSASRLKFRARLDEIIAADESTTTPADAAEAP
jgi:hypothetical protein